MHCHLIHPPPPNTCGKNIEKLATNCMSTGIAYLLTIEVFIKHIWFRKGLLPTSILSHWELALNKMSSIGFKKDDCIGGICHSVGFARSTACTIYDNAEEIKVLSQELPFLQLLKQ